MVDVQIARMVMRKVPDITHAIIFPRAADPRMYTAVVPRCSRLRTHPLEPLDALDADRSVRWCFLLRCFRRLCRRPLISSCSCWISGSTKPSCWLGSGTSAG